LEVSSSFAGRYNAAMLCPYRHDDRLAGRLVRAWELATVLLTVLAAIAALRWSGVAASWWVVPAILVVAGIAPFAISGQAPPAIVRVRRISRDLRLLVCTCLALLPVTYVAVWVVRKAGLPSPLYVAMPSNLPAWIAYQFLYVAVGEEVFFRGYVLCRLHQLFARRHGLGSRAAILVSAALFALAHVVVWQGQVAAALTFLPGLVLGWLYVRTGTLLAPILFHGIANLFWLFATR
jgi:membrane protease YdiL (CAAX protease family)